MSEEILKALMELFAIVVKQDGGIQKEEQDYLTNFLQKQLGSSLMIRYQLLFDEYTGLMNQVYVIPDDIFSSVKDYTKIFEICNPAQ